MATWVYIQSEPQLWTVGFYGPDDKWHSDSDHSSREEAGKRVHYLNGGQLEPAELDKAFRQKSEEQYQKIVDNLFEELKKSISSDLDIRDTVQLDIGHDRKIEIGIDMRDVADEINHLVGEILPPKDDFWLDLK